MNGEELMALKPKKRFSIGGVLCVLLSLVMLVFEASDSFLALIMRIFGEYDFLNILYTAEGLIISLIGGISLFAFGMLLIFKVHSKLLIFFPIVNILICLYQSASAFIMGLGMCIENPDFMGLTTISFFDPDLLIHNAVMTVLWLLVMLMILINCRKTRTPEQKGKMRFFEWAIPIFYLLYAELSLLFGGIASIFFDSTFNVTMSEMSFFETLLARYFGAYSFSQWVALTETVLKAPYIAFVAITAGFVLSWIVRPYRKAKKIKNKE